MKQIVSFCVVVGRTKSAVLWTGLICIRSLTIEWASAAVFVKAGEIKLRFVNAASLRGDCIFLAPRIADRFKMYHL